MLPSKKVFLVLMINFLKGRPWRFQCASLSFCSLHQWPDATATGACVRVVNANVLISAVLTLDALWAYNI